MRGSTRHRPGLSWLGGIPSLPGRGHPRGRLLETVTRTGTRVYVLAVVEQLPARSATSAPLRTRPRLVDPSGAQPRDGSAGRRLPRPVPDARPGRELASAIRRHPRRHRHPALPQRSTAAPDESGSRGVFLLRETSGRCHCYAPCRRDLSHKQSRAGCSHSLPGCSGVCRRGRPPIDQLNGRRTSSVVMSRSAGPGPSGEAELRRRSITPTPRPPGH